MTPRTPAPDGDRRSINVLVIDDSAVVREGVRVVLSSERDLLVHVASDPLVAREKMRIVRPDVILLDLELPRMDGTVFLRELMATDPVPVVICSSRADAAVAALEHGAVDVITKPRIGVRAFLEESAVLLSDSLRGAARANLRRGSFPRHAAAAPLKTKDGASQGRPIPASGHLIAIGASTGGTEAIAALLCAMSPDAPGMVIVQHMPEGFTASFAARLNKVTPFRVKEAQSGDRVVDGRVLLAPGNRHLELRAAGESFIVDVREGPLVSRHRPSVDVLFHSVAKAAGARATGAILTGMGRDGAEGMLAMRQAGATTIAQDEATSVVFGMPKEALARGAAQRALPLDRIAAHLSSLGNGGFRGLGGKKDGTHQT